MAQVTVILPTRNEAECIGETLKRAIGELERAELEYEILIVDDDSTDRTREIVEGISAKNKNVRFVAHPAPHAFGYSVRDAIQMAEGEMSVIMMADLSDDPKFIPEMWRKYKEGFDFIVGSRFIKGSEVKDYPLAKMVSNRMFNTAVMVGFLTKIADTSNNFKAFDTGKAKKIALESKGFEVGAELMLRMLINKAKIAEIPVSWADRADGTAKFRLSGVFYKYFFLYLKMLKVAYIP